jgi:hypothetical protein
VSRARRKTSAEAIKNEPEVPLQITIPPRVKRALELKAVETGRTRRALVLEALRQVGVTVTDEDIVGRRGQKTDEHASFAPKVVGSRKRAAQHLG